MGADDRERVDRAAPRQARERSPHVLGPFRPAQQRADGVPVVRHLSDRAELVEPSRTALPALDRGLALRLQVRDATAQAMGAGADDIADRFDVFEYSLQHARIGPLADVRIQLQAGPKRVREHLERGGTMEWRTHVRRPVLLEIGESPVMLARRTRRPQHRHHVIHMQ